MARCTIATIVCALLALQSLATAQPVRDPFGGGDDDGFNNDGDGDGSSSAGTHVDFDAVDLHPLLVTGGELNVVAGAMDARAHDSSPNNEDRYLLSVTLQATGSGVPEHDIASVRLVLDTGADNAADIGDPVLAETRFDAAGVAFIDLTASGDGLFLEHDQTVRLLVVIDASETVIPERTFSFSLDDARADDDVQGIADVQGRAITWGTDGSALLTASRLPMSDVAVPAGTGLEPVLGIRLHASGNAVPVDQLTIRAAGTALEPVDLLDVRLVLDHNRDGRVDGLGLPGGDTDLDGGVFLADNGDLLLRASQTVPAGGELQLLVCVTINANVPVGATMQLSATDVAVDGDVLINGLPVAGAAVTIIESQQDDDGDDGESGNPYGNDLADPFASGLVASSAGCSASPGSGAPVLVLLLMALTLVAVRRA